MRMANMPAKPASQATWPMESGLPKRHQAMAANGTMSIMAMRNGER